jgi:hypothetical protein
MLWTIVVVLLVLWALGFAVHIGGGLIHLLLVIALDPRGAGRFRPPRAAVPPFPRSAFPQAGKRARSTAPH